MSSTDDMSNSRTKSEDNTNSKTIQIQSNDGETFIIDQGVVEQSSTIKTLFDRTSSMLNLFLDRIELISFK
jgi:hypothetical protein